MPPERDHAGHRFPKRERQSNRAIAEHAQPAGPVGDSVRSSQPNMTHSSLQPACPSSLTTSARAKNHHRKRPQDGVLRSPSLGGRSTLEDASDTGLRRPKEPFARGSPEWYSDDDCWRPLGSCSRYEDGSSRTAALILLCSSLALLFNGCEDVSLPSVRLSGHGSPHHAEGHQSFFRSRRARLRP
jgi:hypothetical protein